jgi:tRNA threonylcarbamoyladenosine biosynthesis protein TsaB
MSEPPPGRILAIDTASDAVSLAIEVDGSLLAQHAFQVETTVSRELLGGLDDFLGRTGIDRDSFSAMAICVGPGGYGGLRAGISTVQGMALALDIPVAPIARLEADAWPQLRAAQTARPVVAVHNAGRAGVAWAAYACPTDGSAPIPLVEPSVTTFDECVTQAPAGAIWCGELIDKLLAARQDLNREGDETGSSNETTTRAASMLALARAHQAYGDPAAADAIYLRPPHITRPKQQPAP